MGGVVRLANHNLIVYNFGFAGPLVRFGAATHDASNSVNAAGPSGPVPCQRQGGCGHTTEDAGIAQLVERNLAKVEVASSNLVSRSTLRYGEHAFAAPRISFTGAPLGRA